MIDVRCRNSIGTSLYSGGYSNAILNQFTSGLVEDHSALTNGYLSRRKNTCEIYKYSGRFGDGVVVFTSNDKSSRYCWITYYVKPPMQ